jgi:hypothetical protein
MLLSFTYERALIMKTRKEMINALVADDLRIIKQDLLEDDPSYLIFLLTDREPYNTWSDKDIKDAYKNLCIVGVKQDD